MNNLVYIFSLPKEGELPKNNQDAAYSSDDGTLIAIADGVSSSLFSREWAQILTREFCRDSDISIEKLHKHWHHWLRPLQEYWRNFYLSNVASLPWYAKGSADKDHGSATFVGLKIHAKNRYGKGYWEALSIGDSCLFKINSKLRKISFYPQMKSREFRSVTRCISSLPEYNSLMPELWRGEYHEDDYFFLATDAISQWIIESLEERNFDESISEIRNYDEFSKFIFGLRAQRKIHNDDTSIVMAFPGKCSGNHSNFQAHLGSELEALAPTTNRELLKSRDEEVLACNVTQSSRLKARTLKLTPFRGWFISLVQLRLDPIKQKLSKLSNFFLCLVIILLLIALLIQLNDLEFQSFIGSKSGYIGYFRSDLEPYEIYYKVDERGLSKTSIGILWFRLSRADYIWVQVSASDFDSGANNRTIASRLNISKPTPVYKRSFDPFKDYYPAVGYLFEGSYLYESRERFTSDMSNSIDDFKPELIYWVKMKLVRCDDKINYYLSSDNSCDDSRVKNVD